MGLRDLKRTLALLPSRGSFLAYLVSSMFYRGALGGMYVFGGIYAAGVLGWGMFEIGLFGALGLLGGALPPGAAYRDEELRARRRAGGVRQGPPARAGAGMPSARGPRKSCAAFRER